MKQRLLSSIKNNFFYWAYGGMFPCFFTLIWFLTCLNISSALPYIIAFCLFVVYEITITIISTTQDDKIN